MTLHASTPAFLETCRQAMAAEQAASLAATDHWAHVDKPQVHQDWDAFYQELAPLIETTPAATAQALVQRHYAIVARFYPPSPEAYIGMALFYQENADMRAFHSQYHPQLVAWLGDAIFAYAKAKLQP